MLTTQEMMEIFAAHGQAEFGGDLDVTMATVSASPSYEIHPLGLRIVGREAIREFYRRSFEQLVPLVRGRVERAYAAGENCLMTEAEFSFVVAGEERLGRSMTVITFDEQERLVSGERVYVATSAHVDLFDAVFGGPFRNVPGVEDAPAHVGSGIVVAGETVKP